MGPLFGGRDLNRLPLIEGVSFRPDHASALSKDRAILLDVMSRGFLQLLHQIRDRPFVTFERSSKDTFEQPGNLIVGNSVAGEVHDFVAEAGLEENDFCFSAPMSSGEGDAVLKAIKMCLNLSLERIGQCFQECR